MKAKAMRVIIAVLLCLAVAGGIVWLVRGRASQPVSSKPLSIVATNFAGYDFARAVAGDAANVHLLLPPGSEAHSYEPTPQDIIKIQEADLLIYNGGESDAWVADIIAGNEIPAWRTLQLMDLVELKTEELVEGMEPEEDSHSASADDAAEYDEHVWTSPANAIRLVGGIAEKLSTISPAYAAQFAKNAESYTAELAALDQQFSELVAGATRRELIFGDRFPFRYFTDQYGLTYYAAFPGCAEQTEPSSSTVAFLIDKVRTDRIPVVLKIELTSGNLAQTIAAETGAEVLTLSAAHNISQEDFDAGVTYADILRSNLAVLRRALY